MRQPTIALPQRFARAVVSASLATSIPLLVIYRPVIAGVRLVRLGLVSRERLRAGDEVAAILRAGCWKHADPSLSQQLVDAATVAASEVEPDADDEFDDAEGAVNPFLFVDDLALDCPTCRRFSPLVGNYYATTPGRSRVVALCDDCGQSFETYRDLDERLAELDRAEVDGLARFDLF